MNRNIIFTAIAATVLLSACSTVKRHAAAAYKGVNPGLAGIDLFGYKLYEPGDMTAPGNLWDLNASAQANLLEIIDRRFSDNESFIRALNNRYVIDNSPGGRDSYINKNLQMVLTVNRKRDYEAVDRSGDGGHPAADRLEYIKISLLLPDSLNLRFKTWNRFKTEYAEMDIADVSFSSSINLSADAGITEGTDPERSAGAGIEGSFSKKEDQALKYRILKFNGMLSDKKIEIEEEGSREIDLTGNIIADVGLSFESFTERVFIPVLNDPDDAVSLSLPALKAIDLEVPLISQSARPVKVTLIMDYVYRHVKTGAETFAEWDDVVEYYTGRVEKEIKLLDPPDYLPPFHCIGLQSTGRKLITARTASGKSFALKFPDYYAAESFLEILKRLTGEDGNASVFSRGEYTLYLDDKILSADDIPELAVMHYYR